MSITYLEAIREAQARALSEDPRVFHLWPGCGAFGGAFQRPRKTGAGIPGRVNRLTDQ